ncbi:MAG: hypothetical protein O7F09_05965 [Chloroflexi bacterium]|nr:hypothetical protein [Chloroflexota bacterium]
MKNVQVEIRQILRDKTPRHRGQWLSLDDRLVVYWGMTRAWSVRYTARALGCSASAVQQHRMRYYDDPRLVFELPLYSKTDTRAYTCRICEETRSTKTRVQRHILGHGMPHEMARDCSLSGAQPTL